jgi:hypothetical protein
MKELVLKDFAGTIEVTPRALELKQNALKAAISVARVETPEQQITAVYALKLLKELRGGMEKTRQEVKRPVLTLGRKIDNIAQGFMEEAEKQYGRLSGLINHFQKKQAEKQRIEADKIQSQKAAAEDLRNKAAELRSQLSTAVGADCVNIALEATKLEAQAFDLEMQGELSVALVTAKPQGLVVKNRLNFQILDAIVFLQAYPSYCRVMKHGDHDNECVVIDRMKILDELNKEGGGYFHHTRFPEELSQTDNRRIVQPAGMRVFEDLRTHIR